MVQIRLRVSPLPQATSTGLPNLGGANGYGTVFELFQNGVGGYSESVLYSFCTLPNCADGSSPTFSNVTFDSAGNLYGTTYYGGPEASGPYSGYGLVFELTPEPGVVVPAAASPGMAGARPSCTVSPRTLTAPSPSLGSPGTHSGTSMA